MEGPEVTSKTPAPIRGYRGLSGLLACVSIALGIIVTFWWAVSDWNDPKFLLCADAWYYYGPALHFLDHCLHHGEFPLWNPLFFCGQPHAANPQSFVFYPPNLLRSLLTFQPTPFKTHVGIIAMLFAELLAGGMGTFLLARRHKISWGGSMVAAFAFALSGPAVTRACGHWVFHNAVCWLPFLLLSVRMGMTAPEWRKRIRYGIVGGLLFAFSLLGGVPQLSILAALAVVVYCGLAWILEPALGRPEAFATASESSKQEKRGVKEETKAVGEPSHKAAAGRSWFFSKARRWGADAVLLALVFSVGGLLSAPLLLPCKEFSSYTERGNKESQTEEDLAPMTAGWELVKALTIYQGMGAREGVAASGATVLLLAFAGLLCRPKRNLALFALLFLVLLDSSLSEPVLFGRVLRWLAPFRMSNCARGMIVACLPLGLLAGAGMDVALENTASLRSRMARSLAILGVGGALVSVLAWADRPTPLLPVGWPALAVPIGVCAALLAGIWLRTPVLATILIALLVFSETWVWNRHLVPACIPAPLRCKRTVASLCEPREFWADNRRETDRSPNLVLYDLKSIMDGYDPLHFRATRDLLCGKQANDPFRRHIKPIEITAQSYLGNLLLKRQFWLTRQYVQGPMPERDEIFPPTTTVFIENPGEVPIPRVERAAVLSRGLSPDTERLVLKPPQTPPVSVNSNALKPGTALRYKAFTLPPRHSSLMVRFNSTCEVELQPALIDGKTQHEEYGKRIKLDGRDSNNQLFEIPLPDFEEVQVEFYPNFQGRSGTLSFLEAYVDSDKADENDLIDIVSRTANRVEVRTGPLPGPRMLLYVDAFYPGWRAYVDGEPAPILRADDIFKAVSLPAGVHRVKFVFRDGQVYAGLWICGLTLIVIAALFGWFRPARPGAPRMKTTMLHSPARE